MINDYYTLILFIYILGRRLIIKCVMNLLFFDFFRMSIKNYDSFLRYLICLWQRTYDVTVITSQCPIHSRTYTSGLLIIRKGNISVFKSVLQCPWVDSVCGICFVRKEECSFICFLFFFLSDEIELSWTLIFSQPFFIYLSNEIINLR